MYKGEQIKRGGVSLLVAADCAQNCQRLCQHMMLYGEDDPDRKLDVSDVEVPVKAINFW